MPEQKYLCNGCRQEYDTYEEAEKCEKSHETAKEFENTIPSKFEVGDIVKSKLSGTSLKIYGKHIKLYNSDPQWTYYVGEDYYCKPIYKKEEDLELILTAKQMEEVLASLDKVLEPYGLDFYELCEIYSENK